MAASPMLSTARLDPERPIFCFSRRKQAQKKKGLRLELDGALAHFRVNGKLATFPAAVSSRRPPELAARQTKDTL